MSAFARIPAELRAQPGPGWVVWRWGEFDQKKGKRKKEPFCTNDLGRHASSTNSATWGTFEQAVSLVEAGAADGIGFALQPPYVGIDLDEELPENDRYAIMLALGSYSEVSVSGAGHHVILKAHLNGGRHPKGFGVFQKGRLWYCSGEHVTGTPVTVEERQAELEAVLAEYLPVGTRVLDLDDQELLERAFAARNGEKVRRLWEGDWSGYPSQSEADLALLTHLAFWTGLDATRMESMFRASSLYREEGPGKAKGIGYLSRTIAAAIAGTSESYTVSGSRSLEIEPAGIKNQVVSEGRDERSSPTVPPESPLPIQRLAVLVETAPAEPEWTWRGYLARFSVALLAGRPKVGKSTLMMALVAAAVRADDFLGLPAKARGVLLLTEERRDTLAEKARILGLMDEEVPVFVLTRGEVRDTPWPEVVRQAMTYCREHELDVLIVDTLDRWTGLRGDAENAAGAVNEAMEPLLFAAAAGLAVLAVSHQRKSGGDYGEAVRGSNAFTGSVDVVIELERPARSLQLGGHARVLRSVSRFSSTPEEFFFELGDDGFLPISDVAEKKADAERAQVMDELERHEEPVSVDKLAENLAELGKRALRRRLTELRDQGHAIRTGEGKKGDPYLWAAAGHDEQDEEPR